MAQQSGLSSAAIGGIVGGTLGGVLLISVAATFFLWGRRSKTTAPVLHDGYVEESMNQGSEKQEVNEEPAYYNAPSGRLRYS